jgi:uncharacterized membrane protein
MVRQRRWSALFLAILFLWLGSLLYTPSVLAQDKSLVWDRFDVNLALNADGTISVAEQQTIRFTSGTFRFGYRDIPVTNLGYIDNWTVTDDSGNRYQLAYGGETPYTFTVEDNGSHYVVHWYFPPQANSTETYTLSYTVHDALRFYEGGDQLWWKAIYSDRGFPVLAGRVQVTTPPGADIVEWAAYINEYDAREDNYATATLSENKRQIVFELQRRLGSNEELEVRVQFPHGVIAGTAPAWQQRADAELAQREADQAYRAQWGPWATLAFGALGLLFALGGPASLYLLWYNFGRDKPVEMVADYLPEPPDTLTPGMAGTLLDESVDMEDIIATLVDLARRQAISITQVQEDGFFRKSMDFVYRRERDDVDLLPYERDLLDDIFGRKDEVKLSDLKNKFYAKLPAIKRSLYDAVTAADLFPRNPEAVRQFYAVMGVLALVGAFVVGGILAATFGDLTGAAVLPGVGLGVTAIGLLILAQRMPRKSEHGAEVAARWRAFKRYLQNIDKYSDLEAQKVIWDRWLPYAIAFGIDREYIRKFEAVDAPAPGWYIPSPTMYEPYRRRYYGRPWVGGPVTGGPVMTGGGSEGGGDGKSIGGGLGDLSRGLGTSLTSMSAGLGALLSSASSTMTSRPASSSSSGGWSSSGGGFSGGGGGFSGGGGGGGGGSGGFG